LVDRRTQSINCSLATSNKASITGLSYDKGHVGWVAFGMTLMVINAVNFSQKISMAMPKLTPRPLNIARG